DRAKELGHAPAVGRRVQMQDLQPAQGRGDSAQLGDHFVPNDFPVGFDAEITNVDTVKQAMASFCESSEPGIGPSTGSADGRSLNVSSHGKKSVATRSEPPTGLLYVPDFVPEDEEAELLTGMERLEFHEIVMHDTPARRTTAHFGWDYGYESRDIHPADPIPEFLVGLRARSAALIDAAPDDLAEVLLTRYPQGATIGWHRDAPMFGPSVVGVSLLGPCVMRFRR